MILKWISILEILKEEKMKMRIFERGNILIVKMLLLQTSLLQ